MGVAELAYRIECSDGAENSSKKAGPWAVPGDLNDRHRYLPPRRPRSGQPVTVM